MTRLTWDQTGNRTYDHGVDRVVIYPREDASVAWTGVTQIAQKTDTAVESYYVDGLKYLQIAEYGEYSATIDAVSYPNELRSAMGFAAVSPGLFAGNQRRSEFDFVYRTFSGDDANGERAAYQLHLVYNALANVNLGASTTNSDTPDAARHSWDVTTRAPETNLTNLRPTAYLMIDSRLADPAVLAQIEDVVYGTESLDPRLPNPQEIQTFFA